MTPAEIQERAAAIKAYRQCAAQMRRWKTTTGRLYQHECRMSSINGRDERFDVPEWMQDQWDAQMGRYLQEQVHDAHRRCLRLGIDMEGE